MTKEWLYGKTLQELKNVVAELGMAPFTASQIASWLYHNHVNAIEEMTNISKTARKLLSEKYELGNIPFVKVDESRDGTKKYLFPTLYGKFIESAYIPDGDRATLCVSSQAGCKMGCRFCMTARQGFQHNLTTGEILNQVNAISERDRLTNIVYMGMGEPLDNFENVMRSLEILTSEWGYGWSPTRITLSTIGVIPAMKQFLNKSNVHLAVSLHNPFHEERVQMMPVEKMYNIKDVVEELKKYDFSHQRRVSFEYIVFKNVNDSPRHIAELARLLSGLNCRINLIRFHKIDDAPYEGADEKTMVAFRDVLSKKGIITTIRASRGEDIRAACGLLSTKQTLKQNGQSM